VRPFLLLPGLLLAGLSPAFAGHGGEHGMFEGLDRDVEEFSLVSDRSRLSFHKPMYLMPLTYSQDFPGDDTEVVFQVSLKQQLFKRMLYFGYTQKSFWQLYDGRDSRPFRETNFNPELFLRFKALGGTRWGVDGGADHESNGKPLPDSRSWNRLWLAGYNETGNHLVHFKVWYRLPEQARETPDDPKGDDNPDIEDYLGYGELTLQRRFFASRHQGSLMLRINPMTGYGAASLTWSAPLGDYAYWMLHAFHGYGESLADYDREITRLGIGVALSR
jgi:phospholipase A1